MLNVAKFTLIALAFTSTLGTVAIGQEKLTFWNNWDGSRVDQLNSILRKFEQAHPEYVVENVTLSGDTTTQRMLTAVASGDVPDLYMTQANDLPKFAALGAFTPLNDLVARDNLDLSVFFDGSIEGSTFDGKLVQLPFKVATSMMVWYNRELFTAAGLDPNSPPKSWEELESAAKATTVINGESIDQLGFNVCINCGPGSGSEAIFAEYLSRNGGQLLTPDATDVDFDSEQGIQTLKWMVALQNNVSGSWNNAVRQFGTTWKDMRPSFYAGKVAMMLDGPFLYNILRNDAPQMLDKVGAFVLPANSATPDAVPKFLAYGTPGYGIPTGSKHVDGAWELLKFIAAEQEGACAFFALQNRADSPLRDCVAEVPAEFAEAFKANGELVESRKAPNSLREIQIRLQEMQENALSGKQSPEDAIATAATDIRAMLAR